MGLQLVVAHALIPHPLRLPTVSHVWPQKKDFHADLDYFCCCCFDSASMVTRSTLPGPTAQCDRIAHCVSNVASTLRLAASSLDEIHDLLRGQPPPAPTMGYPSIQQIFGPLPPPTPLQVLFFPTTPRTTSKHSAPFPGTLRPIAAPSQLGASASDNDAAP